MGCDCSKPNNKVGTPKDKIIAKGKGVIKKKNKIPVKGKRKKKEEKQLDNRSNIVIIKPIPNRKISYESRNMRTKESGRVHITGDKYIQNKVFKEEIEAQRVQLNKKREEINYHQKMKEHEFVQDDDNSDLDRFSERAESMYSSSSENFEEEEAENSYGENEKKNQNFPRKNISGTSRTDDKSVPKVVNVNPNLKFESQKKKMIEGSESNFFSNPGSNYPFDSHKLQNISFTQKIMLEQEKKLMKRRKINHKAIKMKLREDEESLLIGKGAESPIIKNYDQKFPSRYEDQLDFTLSLNKTKKAEKQIIHKNVKKYLPKKKESVFTNQGKIYDTLPFPAEDSVLNNKRGSLLKMDKLVNDSHYLLLDLNEAKANLMKKSDKKLESLKKQENENSKHKNFSSMFGEEDSVAFTKGKIHQIFKEPKPYEKKRQPFKEKISEFNSEKNSQKKNFVEENKEKKKFDFEKNKQEEHSNRLQSGKDIKLNLITIEESDMSNEGKLREYQEPIVSGVEPSHNESEEGNNSNYNDPEEKSEIFPNHLGKGIMNFTQNVAEDDTLYLGDIDPTKVAGGGFNQNNESAINCYKKIFVPKYRERERDFSSEKDMPETILPNSLICEKKSRFSRYKNL